MTLAEEKQLKEYIKKLVRESIFDSMNIQQEENDSKEDSDDKTPSNRKKRILQRIKSKGVDMAQFAYKLWPEKDEDSARSYFYKKVNREENDNGDVYNFTDDEFNRLDSLTKQNQI